MLFRSPRAHLPPRRTPPARRRGMDPPLRTLLEPEARCPRGPASHRRRPPRQDRQARRPPRAQQEEEEEMNATISPAEADYAAVSDTDTVRLQRVLPGPIERVWQQLTHAGLRRPWPEDGLGAYHRRGHSSRPAWLTYDATNTTTDKDRNPA